MMRALYSGVAGLRTHQTRMDVIGNNIANVNTLAFKSSSTTFQDIMYQTTSGASGPTENLGGVNANQIGLGVTTGSTKISIESGGAAESTGEALDIKLTDAQNTHFFIVNNGSENVFTRAGSFYIDSAGNLAMTTTGYLVQGWGVDQETQTIRQDTVSPLRVMSAANRTSQPESTTRATASGILDKNTSNLTSDTGYVMSLNFYDKQGFQYTAKFSLHSEDKEQGEYYISLTDIADSNGNSILTGDNNQAGITINDTNMSQLFGSTTTRTKEYDPDPKFTISASGTSSVTISTTDTNTAGNQVTYTYTNNGNALDANTPLTFTGSDNSTKTYTLSEIFGASATELGNAQSLQLGGGKLRVGLSSTDYTLKFNPADGTFQYAGEQGNNTQNLNLSVLGTNFDNVSIDFTQIKCANNGSASTVSMDKGDVSKTLGTGKKLGNMTGLSVDQNGRIYGSYDNGNTVLLGQIAVAQFENASGLESLGNNCYGTTLNSGDFDGIGVEVSSDGGKMSTGQLEMSNVDLAREFTNMITTQRGFQANSRIITVSDTLLEELVNLKR